MRYFDIASPKYEPLFTGVNAEGVRPDYIVLASGRATGKSVSTALAICFHVRLQRMRVVVCRQFGASIDESMAAEIRQAAMMMGIEHEFEFTEKRILHLKTLSTITFLGLERNKGSIKGLSQIDLCVVEEAQDCSQQSLDILLPTIRKPFSQIWFLMNPRNRSDAVAKTFLLNNYPKSLIIWSYHTDNIYFSDKLRNDMDAMRINDPIAYRNIWLGEFMGADDFSLIYPIVIEEARNRCPTTNKDLQVVAGFDVSGLGDDWSVLIRRRGAEILSIHKKHKATVPDLVDWAKQIYVENGWDKIIVDATGSTGVADGLEVWGAANRTFETVKWNASRSPRNKIKYTNARTEAWGIMRDWLRTIGTLTKDIEWDELPSITYKFTGKEQIALDSKSKLKKSPDFGDALSLSLWHPDEKKVAKQIVETNRYSTWLG
jgi:phage terminase large subunit